MYEHVCVWAYVYMLYGVCMYVYVCIYEHVYVYRQLSLFGKHN